MAEAFLYRGTIPKKYKTPEMEHLFLRVEKPEWCPFRIEDQCTLCTNDNVLMGCDCDFIRPPNCPLNNSDVIVTIRKSESEKSKNEDNKKDGNQTDQTNRA